MYFFLLFTKTYTISIECTGNRCQHRFENEELYLEVTVQEKNMSTIDGKFTPKVVMFCPRFECLLHPKDHTCERKYPSITIDTPILVSPYLGVTSTEQQLLRQNKMKLLQYY